MKNDKNTTLLLLEIFERYTNKDNPLSIKDIILKLSEHGVEIERKTFYREYKKFLASGYDIKKTNILGRSTKYYLDRYSFTSTEAMILMDVVGSCDILTDYQYEQIVDKIRYTQTQKDADSLDEIPFVKSMSNTNNYLGNLEKISKAIKEKLKIRFRMTTKDRYGNTILRRDGKYYSFEPYHLVYRNNKYYVVGLMNDHDQIGSCRVDRLTDLEITIYKCRYFDNYSNIETLINNIDDMFFGKEIFVDIITEEKYSYLIFDLFHDVNFLDYNNGYVVYRIKEYYSDKLVDELISYSFLTVISPSDVVEKIKHKIKLINERYN